MRSRVLLAAAVLARAMAEPIPATKDEEKQTAKTTESVEPTPANTETVYVTIQTLPLTTTFEPPATCTESRLTMLKSQEYRIWLHEPMPVEGSTVGDCYPSQFMKGYSSPLGATSSIVPVMSPLVCPKGWYTAQNWNNGYIACCAEGFQYRPPDVVNTERPAGGATCYSDFTLGQATKVTLYEDSDTPVTRVFTATQTNDQAFGHVIDGYALNWSSTTTEPSMTGAPVNNPDESDDSSSSLSGGAIAGIVIGSLAGVAFIVVAAFFFVRRRRQQQSHEQIGVSRDQHSQQGSNMDYDSKPLPDVYPMNDHPVSPGGTGWTGADGRSEVTMTTSPGMTVASPVSELGGMQRHELASTDYVELDSNQARHEL